MKKLLLQAAVIMNRMAVVMGYLSGAAFLFLACYVGWEAVARKYSLPYTGFSDEVSSYVLAVAGCWAMIYAMKEGSHVRIEAVTSLLPGRLQEYLFLFALFMLSAFGAFLAYHMGLLARESYEIGARGISSLRAPLALPQFLAAFGLAMFSLQGFTMFFCRVFSVDISGKPSKAESEV
jgi:TRAP-type C4-dicarboxylate transport system permease small subunit